MKIKIKFEVIKKGSVEVKKEIKKQKTEIKKK